MLNEDTLNALPEAIYQRLNKINTEYLELIGQKVKEIGELSPGDLRKLQRIQTYGGDIERELERITNKNAAEIYEIIEAVVKDMQTSAKPVYTAKGIEYIPYAKNKELQRYAKSIAKQTVGELVNLTQHTAFCVWSKNGETAPTFFPKENQYKIPTSLSETYSRVIDEAVTAAQSGLTDYNSAMRKTLRAISDSGIRTVDYATGYSRRLDTAVRQNVLWGIKQCCVGTAEQIGEDIGADGWEISYHSNPRPSHEEMGGRQYAAGDGITVNGKYYPPFSDVADLLQDFNCLHYKIPILLGISEPAYDEEELAAMKENDRRKFEFEGKEYTGYEATQVQRKLETEIRKQKDRANLFAASGDDDGRRAAQEKINLLTKKYKQFSDAAGLPTQKERMSVAKFHRVKTATELKRNQLTKSVSSGIIGENIKADITAITDTRINAIPKIEFSSFSDEQNIKLQELHKELLRTARDKNSNLETAFVITSDFGKYSVDFGTDDMLSFTSSESAALLTSRNDLIIAHNHPRNSSFSPYDLAELFSNARISCMTIVKNNGHVEAIRLLDNFDRSVALITLRRTIKNNTDIKKALQALQREGQIEWIIK